MDRDQVAARTAVRVSVRPWRGMKVKANGISIAVEDTGADGSQAGRPVALLIMGLGMQLVAWPPAFVQGLVDAGLSGRAFRQPRRRAVRALGSPGRAQPAVGELQAPAWGCTVNAPYSVHEMAADALGVLDALGIAQAHVVGVSMGGMIAQRVALAAPQRVLSLTSIMSSSGARYLPGPKPQVLRALLSRPNGNSEQAIVDHYIKLFKVIGSPAFPLDEAALRERMLISTRRSFIRPAPCGR